MEHISSLDLFLFILLPGICMNINLDTSLELDVLDTFLMFLIRCIRIINN